MHMVYICIYMCIYIYIEREREMSAGGAVHRPRSPKLAAERSCNHVFMQLLYMYTYIYIYMFLEREIRNYIYIYICRERALFF